VVFQHQIFINGASKPELVGVFITDEQAKYASNAIKMGYTTTVAFSHIIWTPRQVYDYNNAIQYVLIADRLG
jgi:hypothetical protein